MRYATCRSVELIMTLLLAPAAFGQVRPAVEGLACPDQRTAMGDLGYDVLSCNCSHFVDGEDPARSRWEFRSEPVVERATYEGPADRSLRSGDVIVSIDGHLITTAEGGRRFAQVAPGSPVRLRVRRDGREADITIEPRAVCPPARPPAPRAVPLPDAPGVPVVVATPPRADASTAPLAPSAPSPAVAPAPPGLTPPGWLGLSLSCSKCGIHTEGAERVWTFSVPPVVESVEPGGPASVAGLRSGDRVTHIDGVSIVSAEGGRRFGVLSSGQRARLRLERDGATREVELVVGERESQAPVPAVTPAPDTPPRPPRGGVLAPAPQPSTVRFTGVVGTAFVEVTGGPVAVTENEDEVVIRSGDITVRIRKAAVSERDR